MSKIIIFAIAAILIYVVVLSPQMKEKVNEKATNSIKELGTMAIDKITENNTSAVPTGQSYGQTTTSSFTDFGKPSCKTSQDCAQFGDNATCQISTGHCIQG